MQGGGARRQNSVPMATASANVCHCYSLPLELCTRKIQACCDCRTIRAETEGRQEAEGSKSLGVPLAGGYAGLWPTPKSLARGAGLQVPGKFQGSSECEGHGSSSSGFVFPCHPCAYCPGVFPSCSLSCRGGRREQTNHRNAGKMWRGGERQTL